VLYIKNVKRGCGTRKSGATYLDSELTPGGTLEPAVWTLDYCTTDAPAAFYVEVAPRAMVQIDPLASLLTRELVPVGAMNLLDVADEFQHLGVLGRFGLADHVGSEYTPWSFVKELQELGPSRRVPAEIAAEVSKHLPCPVIFTMPLPIIGTQAEASAWLATTDRDAKYYEFTPTWYNERWTFRTREYPGGPHVDAYTGGNHFMVPVLAEADLMKPAERQALGPWSEMPFVLSLFTRAVYICGEGEDDVPENLRGTGVQAAMLVPDHEGGEDGDDE